MVDPSTAASMMNNAGQSGAQSTPYGPPSNPYAPAASGVGDMVYALMQYIKKNQNPGGLGSFEGNIASPANPFNSGAGGGTYGMPGQDPSQGGASAIPYTDPTMQALFSQPPTG
jgi:hypothetical protein